MATKMDQFVSDIYETELDEYDCETRERLYAFSTELLSDGAITDHQFIVICKALTAERYPNQVSFRKKSRVDVLVGLLTAAGLTDENSAVTDPSPRLDEWVNSQRKFR